MAEIRRSGQTFELRLDETELTLINNALNQSLELPAGEFRTLIGGPKKAAAALLESVAAALAKKPG